MERVKLFVSLIHSVTDIQTDLQQGLEGMAKALFGPGRAETPVRWVDAYFRSTDPPLELEVNYQDDWLEGLGCSVTHPEIICKCGLDLDRTLGWAFGLGLEQLAVVLFGISWIFASLTTESRCHKQFQKGKITSFQPYSKYQACLKTMAFRISNSGTAEFCENDWSKSEKWLGSSGTIIVFFVHPKTCLTSRFYRIS